MADYNIKPNKPLSPQLVFDECLMTATESTVEHCPIPTREVLKKPFFFGDLGWAKHQAKHNIVDLNTTDKFPPFCSHQRQCIPQDPSRTCEVLPAEQAKNSSKRPPHSVMFEDSVPKDHEHCLPAWSIHFTSH